MEENKDIYRIFFSWQADNRKVKDAIFATGSEVVRGIVKDEWRGTSDVSGI